VLATLRSPWRRYGVGLLAVAAALGLRWSLWPFLGPELPFLLLWPAVLVAAWLGGVGPGLLVTAVAVAAEDYLVQPGSVGTSKTAELAGIFLFGLLGALTTVLTDKVRRARALIERHAQEAERQREWLRVVLASIGDGVIATDAHGQVAFMNDVAQMLTGWKETQALGQPLGSVFRVQGQDAGDRAACPVRQALVQGSTASLVGRRILVAQGGTQTPVEGSASPIRAASGDILGVVLSFRDFTAQTRLEGELRRRAEELVEADRLKDQFLAMLAHELRNPLAPIRNAAFVLAQGAAGDRAVGAAEVIGRQVGHMTRLVDDLLDVSRVRQGKIRLHKEPVELAEVIEHAIENSRPLLEARMQELVELLPDEPVWLQADAVRLAQVLANLLNNAAKYTDERGRITVSALRQGQEVSVCVRDNGVGIAPEMLPKVFDLFTQVESARHRSQGGLGIGLTLVRDLVRLHGGTVEAHSDGLGKGSEFVVRLPALKEPPARRVDSANRERQPGAGKRVLVVDDDEDAAESLALLLRVAGHEVYTAHDGPAAVVEARLHRPAVVLLDIGLPGMGGHDVARRLREEAGPGEPVLVAVTGYGHEEDLRLSREAGFDLHLTKPVDPSFLQQMLAMPPEQLRRAAGSLRSGG
jgi:PAS domain S-box-containing protein